MDWPRNFLKLREDVLHATINADEVVEFINLAYQEELVTQPQMQEIYEFQYTREKINHLISLSQMPPSSRNGKSVTGLFLEWLQKVHKQELYDRLTRVSGPSEYQLDSAPAAQAGSGDTNEGDSDAESDVESLSRNTSPQLNFTGVLSDPEFVRQKIADAENVYSVDTSTTRGVALLVVNSKVKGVAIREGFQYDSNHLFKLFTWLGYDTYIRNDPTKQEMIDDIFKQTRTRHSTQERMTSFVLCILSEGDHDSMTTSDGDTLYFSEITDLLDSNNFPAMRGKPKLIFLDISNISVRNLEGDSGLAIPQRNKNPKLTTRPQQQIVVQQLRETSQSVTHRSNIEQLILPDPNQVAHKSDIVFCLASFPFYPGLHNKSVGSIATRVLTEVLYKHAHDTHVIDLIYKMRRKLCSKKLAGKLQVITTRDTLIKDFYLFPPTK